MHLIKEWQRLRNDIRAAPSKAKQLDEEITEALYHYRIHLTELQTKPHLLDREIWETYDSILDDLRELKERSAGRLLHKPSTLADLMDQWQNLFARQQELLSLIEQTMERSDFYNKMETAKQRKHRERAQRAEAEAKASQARRSIIQAIHYLLLRERSGESVTADSMVLDLDQAIDEWEAELQQALMLRDEAVATEERIRFLDQLRQRIVDAPAWAENLKQVEEDLDELLRLEEQLRRLTGHGQLNEADIDEMVDLLRLHAAESWVRADWDALDSIIDRIKGYVQRELGPLQSELYVYRKRTGRPFGQQPATATAKDNSPARNGTEQPNGAQTPTGEEHDESDLGSLAEAIRTRPSAAPYARTMVDPDADESIRRAFERPEPANSENGE